MQASSVFWQGPDCTCHPGGGGAGVGSVGDELGIAVGAFVVGTGVGGAGVGDSVGGPAVVVVLVVVHGSEPAYGQIFQPGRTTL
jgi:hypothetical protein